MYFGNANISSSKDLQDQVLHYLRTHPAGVSARQVQDDLETGDRRSRRLTRSKVRRPLKRLVKAGLATRTISYPSRAVTYRAAGEGS